CFRISKALMTPTRTPLPSTTNSRWTFKASMSSTARRAGASGDTEKTTGVITSRTGTASTRSTWNSRLRSSPSGVVSSAREKYSGWGSRYSTFSRSWTRMSVRLTTPTGCPASSITGAALMPLSARRATASRTVASARIDTGLAVIRSAAVGAARIRWGSRAGWVDRFMAGLPVGCAPGGPGHRRGRGGPSYPLAGDPAQRRPGRAAAAVGRQGDQPGGLGPGRFQDGGRGRPVDHHLDLDPGRPPPQPVRHLFQVGLGLGVHVPKDLLAQLLRQSAPARRRA